MSDTAETLGVGWGERERTVLSKVTEGSFSTSDLPSPLETALPASL